MIEPIITTYFNGRITATHGQTAVEKEINIDACNSSEYLQAHFKAAEELAEKCGLKGRFYAAIGVMGGYFFVRSLFEDDIAFKIN